MYCRNVFEGNNEKFCSHGCSNSYVASMEARIREAVKDDPGHTAKMSKECNE